MGQQAERDHQRVAGYFCNPLDLAYRYQDVQFRGVVAGVRIGDPRRSVYREAADPSIVSYKGRYYLFASMSAGFWHSSDLVAWTFVPTQKLPVFDYAPDVREIGGALYISASRKTDSPFFRSLDPLEDDFVEISPGTFPFWDPNLFQDDDGAVYLYWGCDAVTPIQGIRVDPVTLVPLTEPAALIASDTDARGWETVGEDHRSVEPRTEEERRAARYKSKDPYIEGAWMTKHAGIYYLQYSAPATESNTYADGYCVSASPLGPFEYSTFSPFSSKPGGFITGAGHGSTFQDAFGNWWHAATMRISVNDLFERRVGLFPAGFDDEGVLFSNQNFGDYPTRVWEGRSDPWAPPPWMLLSRGASIQATSSATGHPPELAVNESIRDWWVAGSNQPGESLTLDLGRVMAVACIQVNLADDRLADIADPAAGGADFGHSWRAMYFDPQSTELLIDVSETGETWTSVLATADDRPHAFIALDEPIRARYVRVTAGQLPFRSAFAVSGLRVFGLADGAAPETPAVTATRTGALTALIRWEPVADARGYNVRYGTGPEKLYQSWQVHDRNELDLRALNAGVEYWTAVDSFNECGVTAGLTVKIEPEMRSAPRAREK